jgi:hypothetical protein
VPRPQDRPPDYDIQHIQHSDLSTNHAPMTQRMLIEHDPGPSNIQVNTITIETINGNEFEQIMTKQELEKYAAQVSTMNKRKANKAYFDQQKRLRGDQQQLHIGDLVLLHNTRKQQTRSRAHKLDDNWHGPYRIHEIAENSTFYRLKELDGTHLAASFAGNRLKKFFSREALDEQRAQLYDTIRVHDILEEEDDGNSSNGNNEDGGRGIGENLDDIEDEEEQGIAMEDGRG